MGILRNKGYQNQFEGDWMILNPDTVMTGRVVTAQYMPLRPDVDKMIKDKGKTEGRIGSTNSWPIDVLKDGDVYVADSYGKIVDGTLDRRQSWQCYLCKITYVVLSFMAR